MLFISTRDKSKKVTATQAIVEGLSNPDGGLFVPETFPKLALNEIAKLADLDYADRAAAIISKFIPELDYDKLLSACNSAYSKFDGFAAPLVSIGDDIYILELFHGPTLAFKDIALTLLPHLLVLSKEKTGDKTNTLILVATSGDTGKAAIEGFKNVKGTDIIVLYPTDGVSDVQKMQMTTSTGDNVKVIGINGNFDDAQNAVKEIFGDKDSADILSGFGYNLSSANSINFGRLVPQIVYYFSSYAMLVESEKISLGDKVNFCVPSGNFGNILAAYYAKQMGLPINKLISASNKNNVLSDFISSGEYSTKREFFKTTSPSMDILISSNLERLLFELSGRDDALTAKRMQQLKTDKTYSISEQEFNKLQSDFAGGYADETDINETLFDFFDEYGYVLDTHTAVAMDVYLNYKTETGDDTKTVVVSTASPYKFADDVLIALDEKPGKTIESTLKKLEQVTAMDIPESLIELLSAKRIHNDVIDKEKVKESVINYIKNKKG